MAEAVGLVVGVVSLGVQLAESTQKVKRFYNAVKDAPERLADIIDEIESLSEILTEMEGNRTSRNTIVGPKLQRCVAMCRKAVDQFSTYADCLERRIKRHKLRGSTKFALKSESIEGVIARLESSKSNLVLAYMLYREAVADKRAAEMQQQIESIAVGQAFILGQTTSVPIILRSEMSLLDARPCYRGKTVAHLRTGFWLTQTVWEIAVKQAISGWTISLRSRQVVPRGSDVGKACKDGDVSLLRQLFSRREVSPVDDIDMGYRVTSLLTATAQYSHFPRAQQQKDYLDAVRLIIAASENTAEICENTLMSFWAVFWSPIFDVNTARETHRLLLERCDNTGDIDTDGSLIFQLQTFVYGTIQESNISLFWKEISMLSELWYDPSGWSQDRTSIKSLMSCWDERTVSLLDAFVLNGETKYLAGPGAMAFVRRVAGRPVTLPLAIAYVTSAGAGSDKSVVNARRFRELIVEALNHGLDLHEEQPVAVGVSLLLRLLHLAPIPLDRQSDSASERVLTDMERLLHIWLDLLESMGVDLSVYGQEEWRLFEQLRRTNNECERPWDWWHQREQPCSCYEIGHEYETADDWLSDLDSYPTLFTFSYGAKISDWKLRVVHNGDQYAGQFWRMLEQNDSAMEKEAGYYHRMVPGGWVEDE